MKDPSHMTREEYRAWEVPSEEEMLKMRDELFAKNGNWYYQAVWESSPHYKKKDWRKR